MSDLIINGIDHSKFDLEWAKRGGVIREYSQLCKYVCPSENYSDIREGQDGEILLGHEQNVGLVYFDGAISENAPYYLRMATPSECADAGIDYIEPPMMWRPIDTLTTDIPTPLFVCDEKSKQIGILTGQNIFGGACITGWDDHDTKPTQWMPKPQPPKTQ